MSEDDHDQWDPFSALRQMTARLKSKRLGLPKPGVIVRVRSILFMSLLVSDNANNTRSIFIEKDTVMLLVYVNTAPSYRDSQVRMGLVDPVEFIFLSPRGVLLSTGPRAAADVMAPFELL